MAIGGSHAGRGQEFYALLGRCDPGPAAVPRQLQWHDQQQSLSAAVSQVKRQQYEQAIFAAEERGGWVQGVEKLLLMAEGGYRLASSVWTEIID